MAKNACTNNPLWDNTGEGAYIQETDRRQEFVTGLGKFWETYPGRLKSRKIKKYPFECNGLFGTGQGIRLRDWDAFPLKKSYSFRQLVEDYAREYNIPVYIDGCYIFATEKSCKRQLYWLRR